MTEVPLFHKLYQLLAQTYSKIHYRLIASAEYANGKKPPKNNILLIPLYKSGSHLLKNVLKQAGLENVSISNPCVMEDFETLESHQYIATHHPPGLSVYNHIELNTVKVIFNYRDPRDVAVSTLNFVHWESKKSAFHKVEFLKKVYAECFDSKDALLESIIRSDKHIPYIYDISSQFRLTRGLLFHPNVYKIRFEDLIGEQGGGDFYRQVQAVRGLLEFLELPGDAEAIAQKAFDTKSKTFNKGQVGQWKDVFKQHHKDLFNKLYSDILQDYGYEME